MKKPVERLIYMDNRATSFPKPPGVSAAMEYFLRKIGGSPGRSGHRLSQEASRTVFECREALGDLFGIPDSKRIVFTLNATEALNIAILGLLKPRDRVVTTSMEHNSVMRPLRELVRSRDIVLEVVPNDMAGRIDIGRLERVLRLKPQVLIVNHASNVTGSVLPLSSIGEMARAAGTLLLVDSAQSAGIVPIDVLKNKIDLLAFTGHKGLLGPQGTAGLWVKEGVDIAPIFRGGTGSNSELEEQPEFFPDRLESGTQNAVGIAGLHAGLLHIKKEGILAIGQQEKSLVARLIAGLLQINDLTCYGPGQGEDRTAVVSFNIANMAPSEVGFILDETFGILSRVGLHCAPSAHRTIGTYPAGTVRLSPGCFTTTDDIDRVLEACRYISSKRGASL